MKKIVSFVLLNRLWLFAIVVCLTGTTLPAFGQISGNVFRDFDGDGILSTSVPTVTGARSGTAPIENGLGGVTVRAYVELSSVPISTTTTTDGSFAFTVGQIAAGQRVRLEFSRWESGYFPAPHNPNGGGTAVQFVTAPATGVNTGVNYPSDYCQSTNIQVVVPCFVNGDPLKTEDNGTPIDMANQAGTADAIVGFDYEAFTIKGDGNTAANAAQFPPAHLATIGQAGSVWGLALQRRTKQLFSIAVIKRHTGFGPLGLGGIYKTDLASPSANSTSSFLDLTADLGIATGNVPNRNLPGNKLLASADPWPMEAMGRVGLGGADMSEDDKTLYVVNLFDRKVYGLEVGVPAQKPGSTTGVKSWALAGPGCPQGEFRPWALKVYRGIVYVGGVCSGENVSTPVANGSTLPAAVASNTVLSGHVYRLDPRQAGGQFESVLSFPLSFKRGSADLTGSCVDYTHWLPWTNTFPEACVNNFVMWPQPMITDLEFDVDGHMIIGMLDRFGHLAGVANHAPDGNGFYDGFTGGDLLRAVPATGNQFTLENNGGVGSKTSLNGINNGEGPGGGEFYSDDAWVFNGSVAHSEINNGALTLIPGKNEVISSVYDPVDEIYKSAGWKAHNNTNGTGGRGFVVIINESGAFGKASGLGDSKPICDPASVEIGNRVWYDDNRNGIQEAYEPGINGVTVRLYDGSTLVASTTSVNGGQWYFTDADVPGGVKSEHRYQVRMDMSQLATYDLTAKGPANSSARLQTPKAGGRLGTRLYFISPFQVPSGVDGFVRDSDAKLINGEAVIEVLTGDVGQNDQNYDFSVGGCPVITATAKQLSVCQGTTVATITIEGNYLAVPDKVKFVVFDTPQADPTIIYSGTNVLGTVTPNSSSTTASGSTLVTLDRPAIQTNTNSTVPTFKYVYAIVVPEAGTSLPVGCLPFDEIIIVILPKPRLSVTSGTLTCAQTSATLMATLTDQQNQPIANGIYRWTGPDNFTSNTQNVVVTAVGTYTVNAASPNCPSSFTTATASVQSFTTAPVIIDAIGGVPACSTCTTTISVTFTPATATVRWTGPNNFTSSLATPTVSTPGFYTVVVTGPNGCTAATDVEVQKGQDAEPPASLGNFVFYDRDNNGLQGGTNETGVSGVTVELYQEGNSTLIRSLTTGADGLYTFADLTPGCYQVKFVLGTYPTDFVATTANVGSNTAIDSDANPQTGLSPLVCLSAGQDNTSIDAGLVEKTPLGLGDRVWKDLNGNGMQDSGEPGIANFAVELYSVVGGVRSSSALSTTITGGTGNYLFNNLPPGSYQVRFLPSSIPADCLITTAFAGTNRANDSNANVVTGFTDVITLSFTDETRPNRTVDCGLRPCPTGICVPIQTRRIR